jgi:hypothetical protein
MTPILYDVISPDGFPITCEPFNSEQEAREYIPRWCQRFQAQGYYSTARRDRIPLPELPDYLRLVPVAEPFPGCR